MTFLDFVPILKCITMKMVFNFTDQVLNKNNHLFVLWYHKSTKTVDFLDLAPVLKPKRTLFAPVLKNEVSQLVLKAN